MSILGHLAGQARVILSLALEAARIEREIEAAEFDPAGRPQRVAGAVKRWQARVDAQVERERSAKQREAFVPPRSKYLEYSG